MSSRLFDPDALMRDVRAAAGLAPLATTATLLRNAPKRSNVATVAARPASELDEAALADAIEERAALAADRVPAVYLDAWARLNHQKPTSVSEAEWRLALDDGGRFSRRLGSRRGDDAMECGRAVRRAAPRAAGRPRLGTQGRARRRSRRGWSTAQRRARAS